MSLCAPYVCDKRESVAPTAPQKLKECLNPHLTDVLTTYPQQEPRAGQIRQDIQDQSIRPVSVVGEVSGWDLLDF